MKRDERLINIAMKLDKFYVKDHHGALNLYLDCGMIGLAAEVLFQAGALNSKDHLDIIEFLYELSPEDLRQDFKALMRDTNIFMNQHGEYRYVHRVCQQVDMSNFVSEGYTLIKPAIPGLLDLEEEYSRF